MLPYILMLPYKEIITITLVLVLIGGWWKLYGPGSLAKYVGEDPPPKPFKILYRGRSPYQRILVTKSTEYLTIYADGEIMFETSPSEELFCEALVHVPLGLAAHLDDILVIGGGCGLSTREILKYSEVKRLTVVELDPVILNFGRTNPDMLAINQGALNDPRVKVINGDGRAYLENSPQKWNVIIIDVPEGNSAASGRLYSQEFYNMVKERLQPEGVFLVAGSTPSYVPVYYWSIAKTLQESGFNVLSYRLEDFTIADEDYGFHLAAVHKLQAENWKLQVPTRHLQHWKKEMFSITYDIRRWRSQARVQKDDNQVLKEIYEKETADD